MRRSRLELWLATTAIILVVGGSNLPVHAASPKDAEISAKVPMPEPANLPPPTAADIGPPAAAESPTGAIPTATATPAGTRPAAATPAAAPAALPTAAAPAAAPEAAPATAAVPATAAPAVVELTVDQGIADKIHELFGGKSDRLIDRKYKAAVEILLCGTQLRADLVQR